MFIVSIQSPNVYCGTSLCGLSDDGPTLEDATIKSLLGLDLLKSETELDKTGYINVYGSNGLPLLTSEFLWGVPDSPSPYVYPYYSIINTF